MSNTSDSSPNPQRPEMPSASGLLARVAIAAVIGVFLAVCVIGPAEYRWDPTGFGRMTGLLALTTPIVAQTADTAESPEEIVDLLEESDGGEFAAPPPSAEHIADPSLSHYYPAEWHSDTVKIPIGPDGELEYKVAMKKGATIVYSWEVDQGTVYYDFHGQPTEDPDAWQRYREVQETASENGSLTAPMEGIHGWYFLNLTPDPQIVTLKIAGFYELYGYVE